MRDRTALQDIGDVDATVSAFCQQGLLNAYRRAGVWYFEDGTEITRKSWITALDKRASLIESRHD
jgi:hypothetical protein